ncbi:MAG: hypothetical protein Q8916_01190 [Bacteroidota bacterium]|nr:hypothetical protein [Bacteroidota bacterium]MDP4236559.1 hypothetical protein [Bacteroidota bacterium]
MKNFNRFIGKVCTLGTTAVFALLLFVSATWAQQEENVIGMNAQLVFHVKVDDFECKSLIAKNETTSEITIERIDSAIGVGFFRLSDIIPLPRKLAPGQLISLGYACFQPEASNNQFSGFIPIVYGSNGHSDVHKIQVQAAGYIPEKQKFDTRATTAGAIIEFDPMSKKQGVLLAMTGKDEEFSRSFSFKNTSTVGYTVNAIDFEKHDSRFEVSSIEPDGSLPFDVAPGESFSVRILYHSFDRAPFYNHLIITTEQSKEAASYEVRGYQLPLSEMSWNKKGDTPTK